MKIVNLIYDIRSHSDSIQESNGNGRVNVAIIEELNGRNTVD